MGGGWMAWRPVFKFLVSLLPRFVLLSKLVNLSVPHLQTGGEGGGGAGWWC